MRNRNLVKLIAVFLGGVIVGSLFVFPLRAAIHSVSANSYSSLEAFKTYIEDLNRALGNLWQALEHKEVRNKSSLKEQNLKNSSSVKQNLTTSTSKNSFGYTEHERRVIEVVKKASMAVVSIVISKDVPIVEKYYVNPFEGLPPEFQPFFNFRIPEYKQKGYKKQEIGGGSGFIVSSDGLIVTNKHVVIDKTASYTVLTNDGKKYEAKVLARDPLLDVAILKINAKNLPTLQLGDSDKLMLGQTVIAIGNALGEFRNTVSVGVISGLSRTITASDESGFSETIEGVIQTDAAINRGNSGGPLIDLSGRVIGINTAMAQGAENIGFAIPVNQVKRDIESVLKTGKIIVPYIGIRYVIVNEAIKEQYHLPVNYGALIVGTDNEPGVIPYSPAAKAGLKEGDIILEINGTKIDRNHTLSYLIRKYKAGDKIKLKVMRDKKTMNIDLILGER